MMPDSLACARNRASSHLNCQARPPVPLPSATRRGVGPVRLAAWLVLLTSALLTGCEPTPPQVAELLGQTMGTSYSIKLSPAPDETMRTELKQEIEQRLDAINAQMSTYLPDSDLMRFNRTLSTDWQQLPPPVVGLVEQAKRISQLTGGRYDISVGPLVNLWGFGNSGDRDTPPSQQEIDEVMKQVGYQQLDSRTTPPALRKSIAGLQIDLSSIAKGWAVDEIAALLRAKGIMNFLVEIGGELRAQGEKAPGLPWRIAIERPSYDTRSVQRVIALNDIAMATSGDYRNFFTDDKRMYSHTIDPATGQPVEHRLASVTVLAENCAAADAWATALLALGDQQAPDLADSQNLKALFIIRSAEGLVEKTSRALSESGVLSNGGS